MAFQRPFLISLRKDNANVPWGFRLIGGTDVQPQHFVQQVLEGSQAERAGLHEGDEVIQVGRVNVQSLSHREAQDIIEQCRNRVEMFVIREDLLRSRKENEPPIVKAVVHSNYNSPFQLYSTENVADTLALQTTILTDRPESTSKIQLQHLGPQSPPVVIESNVLKLLKEEESQPVTPPRRKVPPPPPPKPSVRFRDPPASAIDITDYGQISDARYQQEQYQSRQQRYQNQPASENYQHQTIGNYQQSHKRQTSQEQKYSTWEEPKYAKIDTTQQESRVPLQSRENYIQSYNQAQRATTAQYQQNQPQARPAYQSQGSYTTQQTISIGQPKTQQQQYQEEHIQQSYQQRVTTTSSSSQQQSYSQQSEQIRQEQIRQEQIRQHELARQKFIQEQARQQEIVKQQQQKVQYQDQARIEQLRLQQQQQTQQQDQARIEQLRLQQQQQTQQQDQERQDQLRQQYQEEQLRQQRIRQEQLRQQQYQQEQLRQQDLLRQQELARQEQLRKQQQLQKQNETQQPGIKIPPVKTNPNYASHVGSMTKTGDRVPLHSTSRMTPDSPTMGSPNVTRRGGGTPVWPPKNSSVRELPRTGFSPNFTHDKGSKKFVWPPQNGEMEHMARPPTPSGGAANAWHPEDSTPTRSLPFIQSPPPNRRNKDIAWPPPHTIQRESPKHSPTVIRRKTGSFDDYIYQHAAVNVPPTYRTPPGTQHVEIVYEDDL